MTRTPLIALLLTVAAAACERPDPAAAPAPAPAPSAPPGQPAAEPAATAYYCDDGSTVRAAYAGDRADLVLDGAAHSLRTALSASGARYVGDGLQWWTRGLKQGRLSALKPGEAIAADPGVNCSTIDAPVAPPDPGRPGGLPDDRTPLAEGPIDPKSAQGSADVVQRYFALLGQGKAAEAAHLRGDGATPDLSPYLSYQAQVGRPGRIEGAAGSLFVEVPIVVYGRRRTGFEVHERSTVVLRRVNDVPGATPDQLRWRIERIAPAG